VVSVAIVVERKEEGHIQTIQRPVYFLSQILAESKTRYPHIQKILYGVYLAKKKLVHYFDAHLITVVTSFPLGEIINNRDMTRWIAKWALELMVFGITYVPRTSIKSEALVDFVAKWIEAHVEPAAADLEY
jgi:hypothetical protein